MKTNYIITSLILLCVVIFVALFIFDEKDIDKSKGKQNILTIAIPGNPSTLDPHKTSESLTMQVAKSFYDTLLEVDGKDIVGVLADSYKVSQDGLTIDFKIKENIKFPDNSILNSEDVKASLMRLKSNISAHKNEFKSIKDIVIKDKFNFQIVLSYPSINILYNLSENHSVIMPKSKIDENWDFGSIPYGTGILNFSEMVENSYIKGTVKKSHFLNRSNLDAVNFRINNQPDSLINGIVSKEIDATIITDMNILKAIEKQIKVDSYPYLSSNTIVLSINLKNPILQDIKFRQAMRYALDSDVIVRNVFTKGMNITTFAPKSSAYYKDFDFYKYDLEKAKELLSQTKYSGQTLTLYVPQNYYQHVQTGEIIQNQLSALGVKVEIQEIPWSTWISDVYRDSKFDLTVIGHTGFLDPISLYTKYTTPDNYTNYDNPNIKKYYDIANTDKNNRQQAIYNIEEEFAKDLPFIPILTNYNYLITQTNIKNLKINEISENIIFNNVIKN